MNKKKKKKSLIILNVCIDRRTEWKTGILAKFVILLKYRNYYYYYYYYYYDESNLNKLSLTVGALSTDLSICSICIMRSKRFWLNMVG